MLHFSDNNQAFPQIWSAVAFSRSALATNLANLPNPIDALLDVQSSCVFFYCVPYSRQANAFILIISKQVRKRSVFVLGYWDVISHYRIPRWIVSGCPDHNSLPKVITRLSQSTYFLDKEGPPFASTKYQSSLPAAFILHHPTLCMLLGRHELNGPFDRPDTPFCSLLI